LFLVGLVGLLLSFEVVSTGLAYAAAKPNIVLFMTDDQHIHHIAHMPSVAQEIRAKGASFEQAFYNDPLCCPSRATMLTGMYAHNTKVTDQLHSLFVNNGNEDRTIAVALNAAGYNTALVGKYLNGYPSPKPGSYVPKGWDFWAGKKGSGGLYYNYTLNENGKLVSYGTGADNYSTDVYKAKALRFLDSALKSPAPFFLWFSPSAPHAPHDPAPRHTGLYAGLTYPKGPAFNEADVADKPAYVRKLAKLTAGEVTGIDRNYRKRAQALKAFDEAVAAIIGKIGAAGRLGETYLVFVSDNGWTSGEHRLRTKGFPYEEVIRMPIYVRGPGIPVGKKVQGIAGNVDLAVTFADWADVSLPGNPDGRSLAGLETSRVVYPLENARPGNGAPAWRGVRTATHTYVRYSTGEEELYDNGADPHQLQNLAKSSANAALLAKLRDRAAKLAGCKGSVCRELENTPL
jgi:arylsulfatase A-like enzyme